MNDLKTGKMRLLARGIDILQMPDNMGVITHKCPCGQTYRGIKWDQELQNTIYKHASSCTSLDGDKCTYPVVTMVDGRCWECREHPRGRGRCATTFVDERGQHAGRCNCTCDSHRKKTLCDTSMRRR